MNLLEYDDGLLLKDSNVIKEITEEIEKDTQIVFNEASTSLLKSVIKEQDGIMNNLEEEYDRLINICKELGHITSCIEKSREKYLKCEEKISELLDKIKIMGTV